MLRQPVILFVSAILVASGTCSYEVTINQGTLRGIERETLSGRKVAGFLGIPYAKPPSRFQKSEPPEPWKGIWNATAAHSDCMSFSQGTYRLNPDFAVSGVEDCLYLDVYTPKIPVTGEEPSMDVIVYIHGGAFMFLYGGHHGPKYLLDKHDIVLVHINYRLGILGFLSTGDDVLPGNNGMKDQSLALQWIQKNIAKFGGNPKSVTITGTSAGGASVHYHYLSPMSKGLFAKGMSYSGTTFVPWAVVEPEEAKSRANELAKLVGCPSSPSKEFVECLKNRPASDLVRQTQHFLKWFYSPFTTFGPVVEPPGKDRFISEQPYDMVKSGKVQDLPWFVSFTQEEGLYPAAEFLGNKTAIKELEDHWDEIAPYLFFYTATAPESRWNEISHAIRDKYFKNKIIHESIPEIIQVQGDRFFTGYITNSAKLQAKVMKSPIYAYQYSYRGVHSASERLSGGRTDNWGVSHGDDTGYIFERNDMIVEDSPQDLAMSKSLVDMVAAFAKSSEAKFEGVEWKPINANPPGFTYLNIKGPGKYEILDEPDVGNEKFWISLNLNELDKAK